MRRCFRSVLFGLLLLLIFAPTIADALPYNSVVYGPLTSTKDGVQTIEVGVVAFGKYDAAMVALGYDGDFIHGLSSDQTALLSNQETGGDFWSFAQKFTLAPNDDLMTLNGITWKSLNALYGYGNVRRGVYTQGEAANAKRDLLKILTDGSLGGGGSVDEGDYHLIALKDWAPHEHVGRLDIDYVAVPNDLYAQLSDYAKSHSQDVLARIGGGNVSGNDWNDLQSFIVMTANPDDVAFNETALGRPYVCSWIRGFNTRLLENRYRIDNVVTLGGKKCVVASGSTRDAYFPVVTDGLYPIYAYGWDYASMGPTIPPSNWPDTPEVPAPTAPEVPTPTEPDLPTQPSTPTAPTLPDFPSNVITPGTTYETFDIQAILDAMDEHCQHLQSAVYQGFSDYFDTFTPWLRDEFSTLRTFLREEDDWIVESISDEFMELRSYLKELAEWLADQMDFTITGGDYDDSTVVSWLKKIYYKLGGASVNTKPVDPVGDPDGSWDWLTQLVEAILSALANGAAGLAGTLGDLFQGIKDKFPFSIPWDIVAIVALLDAPPVTPSAVIEYDVFGAHVRYDIDLHFFDEQASVIRAMEDVLFCAFLLFKTDWLTGIFDGIGGFLGGKLKSTVKGA